MYMQRMGSLWLNLTTYGFVMAEFNQWMCGYILRQAIKMGMPERKEGRRRAQPIHEYMRVPERRLLLKRRPRLTRQEALLGL